MPAERRAAAGSLLPRRQAWRPRYRDLPIDVEAALILNSRRMSPQQQVVLGQLLVHGRVSLDRLMDALWGSWLDTPDGPLAVIRVLIHQLRRRLDGSGAAIISLHGRGYALERVANDNRAPSPFGHQVQSLS